MWGGEEEQTVQQGPMHTFKAGAVGLIVGICFGKGMEKEWWAGERGMRTSN